MIGNNKKGYDVRKEIHKIPKIAIRKMVINAFAYGEYDSNTDFEIDVYKNRICFYSPGFPLFGYKPEDFASNNEKPIILNPKIVNVLFGTNEFE